MNPLQSTFVVNRLSIWFFFLFAFHLFEFGNAATLRRREALAALLAPASGVAIEGASAVWCPFVDFGEGVDREGLAPVGTIAEPRFLGVQPWPGAVLTNETVAYFFWIDDEPAADFIHATRFVLVAADHPAPTVANGRIRVAPNGWWPVLRVPGGSPLELWETSEQRTSDEPIGPLNRDGAVAGKIPLRTVNLDPVPPRRVPALAGPPAGSGTACALIVRGSSDGHMSNNAAQFQSDLVGHFGVPEKRIVMAADGGVASCEDLVKAIEALCKLEPACSRIYVRFTSHGGVGCLKLGKDCVPARELCTKLNTLGVKGVPIHMLINACYSFSLVDTNNYWAFPAGSTIVTSANSNRTSYGGPAFSDSAGNSFAESLYARAFSECLKAGAADANGDKFVDDCEAHDWVKSREPPANCFEWKTRSERRMLYPANTPPPFEIFDPNPQKVVVGDDPTAIGLQVLNGTGKLKSDFHMIFAGDVTDGKAEAKRADGKGAVKVGAPWGKTNITHDPIKNETMVCWDSPNDMVRPGDFMIFRYRVLGKSLRFLRAYWTPTSDPPADEDKIPTKSASLNSPAGSGGSTVRQLARGDDIGGWGYPWGGQIGFAVLSQPLDLEGLDFSNPNLLTAASNRLGNVFLLPNQSTALNITLPKHAGDTEHTLVFISQGQSPANSNSTLMFEAFSLPAASTSPIVMQVRRVGSELEIFWNGGGVLQATDTFGSPWQNVPGNPQGSHRLTPSQHAAQFFRVTR